jgi:pimeloyl-ACP methyl ester carboxylesterase
VPDIERDDGVVIHWEQAGEEGPLVLLTSYWSMHPSVYDPIIAELEGDHRVVRYDDRGAGESTKQGPYDLDTAAADLAAVIEAAGPPAVIVAQADGTNRAVRVAHERPELVSAIASRWGAATSRASRPWSPPRASSRRS